MVSNERLDTKGNEDSMKVPETIVFSTYDRDFEIVPHPVSAEEISPDWDDSSVDDSISKALELGWIIRTPANVQFLVDDEGTSWKYNFHREAISTHSPSQMGDFSIPFSIIKFHSYWTVHLPNGYSALLTAPFGYDSDYFTPFSGCIDFDRFHTVTHAPTLWEYEGRTSIPEGTPLFQVIPFNREEMLETAITRDATDEELSDYPFE